MEVRYTPEFVRSYQKFESSLQEEIKEKITLLKNKNNHEALKVHKLHGRLHHSYSFSINYKYRIVFEYINNNIIALENVSDHDVYK